MSYFIIILVCIWACLVRANILSVLHPKSLTVCSLEVLSANIMRQPGNSGGIEKYFFWHDGIISDFWSKPCNLFLFILYCYGDT